MKDAFVRGFKDELDKLAKMLGGPAGVMRPGGPPYKGPLSGRQFPRPGVPLKPGVVAGKAS